MSFFIHFATRIVRVRPRMSPYTLHEIWRDNSGSFSLTGLITVG